MRDITTILFLSFIFYTNCLQGQSTAISSNIPKDNKQLLMYFDTIDKYMYRNTQIVAETINKCEEIIKNNKTTAKNDLLRFGVLKIYFAQNQANYLGAYQIVNKYDHLLYEDEVNDKIKGSYTYIKGFTFMSLGDLESAQKAFYTMLDNKRETYQDSVNTFNALYSLGQLYSDEGEYETAIKYFLDLLDLLKVLEVNASSKALVEYELCESYLRIKEFDKAAEVIERALKYLELKEIDILYPDFMLYKGEIALHKKDFKLAEKIDQEVYQLSIKEENPPAIKNSKLFRAKLFSTKKQYTHALEIYEALLEEYDSTFVNDQMDILKEAHKICHVIGDDSKAYYYSNKLFETKEKIDAEEKRKQTSYLKIKFESEQKEIENQNLSLEILKKKNQNKLLYIYILVTLFGFLLLFWAFYQKRKYSQKLQEEVFFQTKELQSTNDQLSKSNAELDELNNILSHDLKEPLRSIVGFSQLVKKENPPNKKIINYINHIEKSGNQLYQLIHDVSIFQSIKKKVALMPEKIDMNLFMDEIKECILDENPQFDFKIYYHEFPTIFAKKVVLKWTFLNLIQNGIKFNKHKIPTIEIRYLKKEGNHFFVFKDNGIGIDPSFHDKVFGMFKRLNSRDVYQGSGLGLSIVKRMMESINGKVCILESNENEGSVFEISFPIIENDMTKVKVIEKEKSNTLI